MSGYPLNNTNYNWERRMMKAMSDGGGGGDQGDKVSMSELMEKFETFDIKIIKEKSGVFTQNGNPLSEINAAPKEYYDGSEEPQTGTPTPIDEYFDVSDINTLILLVEFCKEHSPAGYNTTLQWNFDDTVITQGTEGRHIEINRSRKYYAEETLDDKVSIYFSEAFGGSGASWLKIYIDPEDSTKFWLDV